MRLKEDNSNWKSGGIIRRDFRHSRSEPEIPKAPKKKPVGSKSLCPKRDGEAHDPVVIVERRYHLRDRDVEGVTYKVYKEHLVIRCASCKTTDLSPALLAPFYDLLSTKERSEVLAEHWCKKGHLYESVEPSPSAYSSAFRLRRPMETCAMCGRRKSNAWNPAPIKDANLLAGAGVPEKAAALVIAGRAGNPRERIIEELVDMSGGQDQQVTPGHVHDWMAWETWVENPYYLIRHCRELAYENCGGVIFWNLWENDSRCDACGHWLHRHGFGLGGAGCQECTEQHPCHIEHEKDLS